MRSPTHRSLTPEQFKQIFPHASKSTIQANADSLSSGPDTQSPLCDGPLAKEKGKGRNPSRRDVRVTSYRVRFADADGLCAKYFVDALRYAGVLHDDREEDITYQICQKKVAKKNQEKTLIEVS